MPVHFPLVNVRRDINNNWEMLEITETITVPSSPPYIVKLREVPDNGNYNSPPIISGLTRNTVNYSPASGEYSVKYSTGEVIFNVAQKENTYDIIYYGKGSLIEAEYINYLYNTTESLSSAIEGVHIIDGEVEGQMIYWNGDYWVPINQEKLLWDPVNSRLNTDSILFDTTFIPTDHVEGQLHWHADDGCLEVGMAGDDVSLQVGLENLLYCTNRTGDTIPNGRMVYITGVQGNRPTIDLSSNNNIETFYTVGMTTEDLLNNESGYLTVNGYVRNLDTTGTPYGEVWTEGDKLYLGIDGELTNQHPSDVLAGVAVCGTVIYRHQVNGIILIYRPNFFSRGNDYDGILRYSVINNNIGVDAVSSFTSINDASNRVSFNIIGSNNTTFTPNSLILYNEGYAETNFANDGAVDFIWTSDPLDGHNYGFINNEIMRLSYDGKWTLDKSISIEYDGVDTILKTDELSASDLLIDCGENKTVELQQVVWDDLRTPSTAIKLSGSQPPIETPYRGGMVLSFPDNLDKTIYFNVQLPHKYKLGSDIEFHIHIILAADGAGIGPENIKFDFTYSWNTINDVMPIESSVSAIRDVQNDSANTHYLMEIASSIDGSNINGVSSMLICSLKRDDTVINNYANDVYLLEVDFHYQINTMGSRQQAVK